MIKYPINTGDLKYLAALGHFPKFGQARIKKLKKHFSTWENAFNATAKNLIAAGLDESLSSEFLAARPLIRPDEIMARLAGENIKITYPEDNLYPALLKEIHDSPELLYYKGTLLPGEISNLAVVGTRKFTGYGAEIAKDIVTALAKNRLNIISGLAVGIDAIAHDAALTAGGRTVGVLGSGLDKESIYPGQNRMLADKIISSGGAIISEFPLGTPPLRHNFPQRNRIVAGMSLGTLVIEADEKSGALITARLALDYNREVMAVPGSVYSQVSNGTNLLIKQGAKAVTASSDVLEALNLKQIISLVGKKSIAPETPEEAAVFDCLKEESRHINEIVRALGLDTSKINSTLAIMEMKGMVCNLGNMTYAIK